MMTALKQLPKPSVLKQLNKDKRQALVKALRDKGILVRVKAKYK